MARFLSHAETLRAMHRVFIRAEINLVYSCGFNPHPRLSLALPRSVGVESEDELCIAEIREQIGQSDFCRLIQNLSSQLPCGFEITSAEITKENTDFMRGVVSYLFSVGADIKCSSIADKAEEFLKQEKFVIKRVSPNRQLPRQVDIRKFVKSIDVQDGYIAAGCIFGPDGTIRIDELLQLFGLSQENLISPVRRVRVDWNCN